MKPYPLIFTPIFKPKPWGGRRLESALGKTLPAGDAIGESWELADMERDQSIVRVGPATGMTLGDLVGEWGADLLGGAPAFEGRFPLLIKFLDASQNLSVQVHPDQVTADRLGGDVRVKHEAWYVVEAEADGAIYLGLRDGVTRDALRQAAADGTVADQLRRVPVRAGQCYYLPSGTVHALGAGVMVAEVQTPSDITYRLYDWGRIDPATNQPRALHLDQALSCVDLSARDVGQPPRSHVASIWTSVTQLVRCPSFTIERVRMIEGVEQPVSVGELIVWIMLEGSGRVMYPDGELKFAKGDTILVPAGLGEATLKTDCECCWLEVTVPVASDLSGFPHPGREALADEPDGRYIQLRVPQRDDPGPD